MRVPVAVDLQRGVTLTIGPTVHSFSSDLANVAFVLFSPRSCRSRRNISIANNNTDVTYNLLLCLI